MREAPVNVGDVLAGKYAVERVLGAGTMGFVVAARQVELDRRVALKFMTAAGARLGSEHHERFLREARIAAKLQGQHVTRVLDVGTLAEGQPYIVMEFLDGKDLAAVLEERGPLPIEEDGGVPCHHDLIRALRRSLRGRTPSSRAPRGPASSRRSR